MARSSLTSHYIIIALLIVLIGMMVYQMYVKESYTSTELLQGQWVGDMFVPGSLNPAGKLQVSFLTNGRCQLIAQLLNGQYWSPTGSSPSNIKMIGELLFDENSIFTPPQPTPKGKPAPKPLPVTKLQIIENNDHSIQLKGEIFGPNAVVVPKLRKLQCNKTGSKQSSTRNTCYCNPPFMGIECDVTPRPKSRTN